MTLPNEDPESGVRVHTVLFSENGFIEISYSEERDRELPITELRSMMISVDDLLEEDSDSVSELVGAVVELIDAGRRRKRNPPDEIPRKEP